MITKISLVLTEFCIAIVKDILKDSFVPMVLNEKKKKIN